MTKKKYKIYAAVCAFVAAICCLLPFVLKGKTVANASYAVETSETVRESYMLGEKFTIPSGELVEGDNRYQAEESMLKFPDGTINVAKEQTLSQMGDYALLYTAKVEGKTVSAQKTFTVVDSYYTFSGDSAENAKYEWTDAFNMAPESDLSGLRLQIPMGSTFHINEPFDVSTLTKEEPVITIYPYSSTFLMGQNGKTVQADELQIVLTDYYDPTNYIVLTYYWVKPEYTGTGRYTNSLQYWAGSKDSPMYCMAPSSAETAFEYNGATYVRSGTYYGTDAWYYRSDVWKLVERDDSGAIISERELIDHEGKYSMDAALPEGAEYSHSVGLSLYFDYETKDLYATNLQAGKKFVTNLGLSEVYGDKAFKGFTRDKFYVSIRGNNYRVASGQSTNDAVLDVEISNLAGRYGDDLFVENMSEDTNPPHIQLEGVEGTVTVAKGEKIKIPTPVVKDVDLKRVVSEVYYGYGTAQQSYVAIHNGTFTPSRVGYYTIVYTAEDYFGNVSTYEVNLQCKLMPDNQSLRLVVDEVESPEAGAKLKLPQYSLEGNYGKTAKVYYAYADGEFVEVDENEGFFVEHVGDYKIRYEYWDLFVSYEYEYEFTSVASQNVTFTQAVLPNYFVKGNTYTLERLGAFTYTEENPEQCALETYVSEDGGAYRLIDANAYVVQANETVRFKYVLDSKEEYSEVRPVKVVRNGNDIYMWKHFATNDFDITEDYNKLVFTPKNAEVNTAEFVNPISLSNFALNIRTPEGYAEFNSIEITLTDYYDHSRQVKANCVRNMVYATTGDYYGCVINCAGSQYIDNATHFEGNSLQVSYSQGKLFVGKGIFAIDGMLGSDKVLLSFALKGANPDESKIEVMKLNNVVLSDYRVDDSLPQLGYRRDCADYEKLGAEITVYPAEATDVLSTFVLGNLKMWVKGPNNSDVTATDGTVLNEGIDPTKSYTFRLEKRGTYTVTYTYTDTNGNPVSSNYRINILDDEAPTITLNGGYNENTLVKAKVGETHKVQTYVVTDNQTPERNLIVDVISEAPDMCVWPVYGEVVFTMKGTWRIYYYCLDERGNMSYTYYTVQVE